MAGCWCAFFFFWLCKTLKLNLHVQSGSLRSWQVWGCGGIHTSGWCPERGRCWNDETKMCAIRSDSSLITWSATWAFLFQCSDNSLIFNVSVSKCPKPFYFQKHRLWNVQAAAMPAGRLSSNLLIPSHLKKTNHKLMNVKWFQLKSVLFWCWERRRKEVWHCTELAHKNKSMLQMKGI